MATYSALAATTAALVRMLSDGFPTNLGVTGVKAFDPASSPAADTAQVLLWLYRFVPVPAMRNRPVAGAPKPDVRPGVRPSAVAVDLHYLLWAHGVAPAAQQAVVGWALRRLSDRPILTSDVLNQGGAVFKATEDVALLVEDLPLAELLALSATLGAVPPLVLPIHARSIHLEGE
ncbi:MAG TPA: Pvc16 family protein [Burkholderiaceae bacterium]|nr:Pvc16 family protein [Burkholderiaceae bacterium]HQR71398.1 Pvc16 family protein [Burkholderiaceae bacterium]